MTKRYQVLPPSAPVPAPDDVLEMVVREGARKMLAGVRTFRASIQGWRRNRARLSRKDERASAVQPRLAALATPEHFAGESVKM